LLGVHLRTCKCHCAVRLGSVVVITFASHVKGPQCEPGFCLTGLSAHRRTHKSENVISASFIAFTCVHGAVITMF